MAFESPLAAAKKLVNSWHLKRLANQALRGGSPLASDEPPDAPPPTDNPATGPGPGPGPGTGARASRKATRFRVYGWRWHHLGIVRDLRRLHAQAEARSRLLCSTADAAAAQAQRAALRAALAYILDDNWRLHNTVEQRLFVPWLLRRAAVSGGGGGGDGRALRRDVAAIAAERTRLVGEATALAVVVDRWVRDDPNPYPASNPFLGARFSFRRPAGESRAARDNNHPTNNNNNNKNNNNTNNNIIIKTPGGTPVPPTYRACKRELNDIQNRISHLAASAQVLFNASEAALIPRVRALFSEVDQLRFNHAVIRSISPEDARKSLVMFRDAVDRSAPVLASRADWADFHASVPIPIRKIALPYWRHKFVSHKTTFLTNYQSQSQSQSHTPR